ncbi:MAG: bile acid:sodium symporter [Patescibacteria group bacterium]|nr:bile acid:sodium symporter [Patescibacteria group bacterium]MBU2509017.1 bile acid:sodium symporter [Patescibacteria group bacterium]
MIKRVTYLFLSLVQSYLFIIIIALGAGLTFPDKAIVLAPFTTLFLQIVFFLTSLKLDPKLIFKATKDYKMLLATNIFMLLLLPAVVFLLVDPFVPALAIVLLLLSAMPSGMTTPLLTEVVGGNTGLALVLTLTTSLLAPITVPLVISIFAKTAVTVSAFTMFWSLVKVIIVPFILAQIVRHFFHKHIKFTFFTFKPISLLLLGLLIAGEVARQAWVIVNGIGTHIILLLIVLFIFTALLFVAGYFVSFWRPCQDRLTIAVTLTFMNFTLAIYLAGNFFSDPNVLLASVLVIFPWTLMLLPFKTIVRRYVCPIR